jgi:hypothetical protein
MLVLAGVGACSPPGAACYRVGLALIDEEDDHFERFASAVGASADLEAWRVDGAHGLDIATLDTYAFALAKGGRAAAAVAVQTRTLALCDLVTAPCGEEHTRFDLFKSQ